MNCNFAECLAAALRYEGGYVNNPSDPGGPTNMGITITALSAHLGRQATIRDVQTLKRSDVSEIYRKNYWDAIGADWLPGGVDAILFDIAVNSGAARALKWGSECSGLSPAAAIHALDVRRRAFLCRLPTFRVFGRGWVARENDILNRALALCKPGVLPVDKAAVPKPPAPGRQTQQDRPAQKRTYLMKGYRTYIASGLLAFGGVIAQTDWVSFLANPKAGLVALGSAALMAVMRSVTSTPPAAAH